MSQVCYFCLLESPQIILVPFKGSVASFNAECCINCLVLYQMGKFDLLQFQRLENFHWHNILGTRIAQNLMKLKRGKNDTEKYLN